MQNLCNLVEEQNLDTFYRILIAEASSLPRFDNLTSQEEILTVLNSLPSTHQAMIIPLLPEKYNIGSGTKLNNRSTGYAHNISFPLVPQDAAIKSLLETYNNKTVVAFLTRQSHSYLYGTSAQPMLFTFDELHAPNKTSLKGYTISMQGESYGPAIYFAGSEEDFPVINRGLAFQLAGTI